jgi:transposase InsO family protein
MDFITGLPTTRKGNDSIWVIVDRLIKSAHFQPVSTRYRPPQYADQYITKIVQLHGIPKAIMFDRGSQFTAHVWEHLHKGLGTSLVHSTAYHPQTDGQTERVNQVLEDMLRACVLSSEGSWESWLPLAEFSLTTVIKKVLSWLRLKPYMAESAERR